jgi:hypothetical protein
VICAEREDDAEELVRQLEQRLGKGKLRLSLEKTRIVNFRRPDDSGRDADSDVGKKGGKPGAFNFLGFTHYWEKGRKGFYKVGRRTMNKSLKKAVGKVKVWLRANRNRMLLKDVWIRVSQMLIGHYSYYGVSGNFRKIKEYHHLVERLLFKWLNRRSQKKSFNWKMYGRYEQRFPLPKPKIYHKLY